MTACDTGHSCVEEATCLPRTPGGYECLCPLGKAGRSCSEGMIQINTLMLKSEMASSISVFGLVHLLLVEALKTSYKQTLWTQIKLFYY